MTSNNDSISTPNGLHNCNVQQQHEIDKKKYDHAVNYSLPLVAHSDPIKNTKTSPGPIFSKYHTKLLC